VVLMKIYKMCQQRVQLYIQNFKRYILKKPKIQNIVNWQPCMQYGNLFIDCCYKIIYVRAQYGTKSSTKNEVAPFR
jgi:hypothetical protein